MTLVKKQFLLFIFLALFGISLRLISFGKIPFSLFSDEVDIGYQALSFKQTGRDYFGNFLPLQFHSLSDVRASLPIYAAILVSYLPGISLETAIRLAPLLFAAASLLLIYFFMNSFWDYFRLKKPGGVLLPGHFAVFTLSLMPWHFTYSRTGFELSQLFFFTLLGFYLYFRYLLSRKTKTLVFSLIVLGLTPMVYSTAKLALVGYPLVLWLLADGPKSRRNLFSHWYLGLVLFLPLLLLFLNGGAGRRFSEIAIFTDPTISSEVNYARQTDLGPKLVVGSSPSLLTKIVHNKATLVLSRFLKNSLNPLSTSFLFAAGDRNQRHAVPGWGMLLKTFLILLTAGLFYLANKNSRHLLVFLGLLTIIAVISSALTRDGADHGSRLFMLILPVVIILTLGWVYLCRFRLALVILLLITLVESFFYFHDYFMHYPYVSEKDFHTGLKEVVLAAKAEKTLVAISPRYEPPLIFYLFYTKFPAAEFQSLIRQPDRLYRQIDEKYNLEGFRVGDTPLFIAGIRNPAACPLFAQLGIYYLTFQEAASVLGEGVKNIEPLIKTPSGLPLFYRIEVDELPSGQHSLQCVNEVCSQPAGVSIKREGQTTLDRLPVDKKPGFGKCFVIGDK